MLGPGFPTIVHKFNRLGDNFSLEGREPKGICFTEYLQKAEDKTRFDVTQGFHN